MKIAVCVKHVPEGRSRFDPESKRLVERYHLTFVRAGADLNDGDKVKLRALNEEESTLTTKFQEKLLKDKNDSAVVVTDKAELDAWRAVFQEHGVA